ncbi:MAG: hypothetical protein HUJ96_08655 [Marinilabiliaceae bacterium]|nr:hypothetical protein [Marinilabiliaceae bacterium]
MSYRLGTDLILSFKKEGSTTALALGHSTGCKISKSAQTGSRTTKEQGQGLWEGKYVKSLAASVSADGFVFDYDEAADRGYPTLNEIFNSGKTVELEWKNRDDGEPEHGSFIITKLDLDATAGDDQKYSVTFENSGAVEDGELN